MIRHHIKRIAVIAAVTVRSLASLPVHAEEIENAWDEDSRVHTLRRRVATAINVYTDKTEEAITHEEGVYENVIYDILRVNPSEHTFLQVDYRETPGYVNELKDPETIAKGFAYAGGINAGYFSNADYEYGKPVGAVRRNNDWAVWNGEQLTPAYGNGFATAYLNGDTMKLKYHGWAKNFWFGDKLWTWWNGYSIDADFAVSGSFTYYADGVQQDITNGDRGEVDYRTFGRAVTILAQKPDKQYLLITFYGTVAEDRLLSFLTLQGVSEAIRLDGGGSTQMVYETDLVKTIDPLIPSETLKEESEDPIGYALVNVDQLRVRAKANTSSETRGTAINGERYQVFETSDDGTYTWYRIGKDRWIAGKTEWVTYETAEHITKPTEQPTASPEAVPSEETEKPAETAEPSASPVTETAEPKEEAARELTVIVDKLNIRTAAGLNQPIAGAAVNGKTYPILETAQADGYTWYRIGENQWIAGDPDWIEGPDKE